MAKTWVFVPNLPVGLFYHVSYDMATPYNVCGGMQDNYDWCGPSAVRGAAGIANYQWQTLQGGDGFVVLQDPTDYRIVYSETQDGNMVRADRVTGETVSIRPQPAAGEPPLRWQWDTPLVLSPHDHKVIYAAAQKVFRSADRGLTWAAISPDLTNDVNRDEVITMGLKGSDITISKNDGISAFSTIVQFAESPKRAGLYYAGTDDGNVQVSRDAGKTWTNVTSKIPGVPKNGYVSEVAPSRFDEGTVYVTFDDHRQDNFDTYVYVSTDYGQTFQSLASNLKGEVVKTLTEDLEEPGRAVCRHRDGSVRDDRSRPDVEPAEGKLPDGAGGRDHAAPARQCDAHRHARTRDLDPRSSRTDPGIRRGPGDHGRREAVLAAAGGDVPAPGARSQLRILGRPELLRREPAAGGRHLLVQQEGRRRGEPEDHGRAQSRRAGDLRTGAGQVEHGGAPGGVLGFARAADPGAGRPRRNGPRRRAARVERVRKTTARTRPPSAPDAPAAVGAAASAGAAGAAPRGRSCCRACYSVALVIDGRTVETRPLRVTADPEVALTELERRKMYDMAMEMHELQKRGAEIATSVQALQREATAIATAIGARTDVPAEIKASFEAFDKDLTALAPKFAAPAGGRGGGRGAAPTGDQPIARAAQAKNGLMGTMPLTEGTTKAYADAKAQMPKAVTEANAVFAKAATLAPTLAKYNLTLTPPPQIRTIGTKSSLK